MAQRRSRQRTGLKRPPRRTPRVERGPTNARQRETRNRALHALAHMRTGLSRSAATRLEHIKPSTFMRHAGRAVRQDTPGGRYRALATDRLPRELEVPSARGPVRVSAKGIKQAREFSRYANAVLHFNRTGDISRLTPFRGKTFAANGERIAFVTDPTLLMELAEADALRLDQLYASLASRS